MIKCWVCGKRGHWNVYADRLGMRKLDQDRQQAEGTVRSMLDLIGRTFREERTEPAIPVGGIDPWSGDWRGAPEKLLLSLGSGRWYDPESEVDRIIWPVRQNERLHGYTAAKVDPLHPAKPSTRNLSGLPAGECLWPYDFDFVWRFDGVLLCEGQADTVRALAAGIPALCVLGVKNWSRRKANLLVPFFSRVIVGFDGDPPGVHGAAAVEEDLREYVAVDSVRWPRVPPDFRDQYGRKQPHYDIGNCPDAMLRRIRAFVLTPAA